MPYCLNKVQGFCPVKIEITQFPDGFRLKTIPCSAAHTCCLGQIKESPSIPSTPPRPPPSPLQSLGTILKTRHTTATCLLVTF